MKKNPVEPVSVLPSATATEFIAPNFELGLPRPGKIYGQMIKVMADVDPIAKDKQGHGYKFRGIDDVYAALQAILAKHGVFTTSEILSDRSEERTSKQGNATIYRVLKIRYTFWADDGSSVTSEVMGEGMDTSDKASNKAMSVAHKYALLQAFSIPTVDPKDPENEDHDLAPRDERRAPNQDREVEKPPQMRSRSGKILTWTAAEFHALIHKAESLSALFDIQLPEHKDLFGKLWKFADLPWEPSKPIRIAAEAIAKNKVRLQDLDVEIDNYISEQKAAAAEKAKPAPEAAK